MMSIRGVSGILKSVVRFAALAPFFPFAANPRAVAENGVTADDGPVLLGVFDKLGLQVNARGVLRS